MITVINDFQGDKVTVFGDNRGVEVDEKGKLFIYLYK